MWRLRTGYLKYLIFIPKIPTQRPSLSLRRELSVIQKCNIFSVICYEELKVIELIQICFGLHKCYSSIRTDKNLARVVVVSVLASYSDDPSSNPTFEEIKGRRKVLLNQCLMSTSLVVIGVLNLFSLLLSCCCCWVAVDVVKNVMQSSKNVTLVPNLSVNHFEE